ncbi:hypothetical protein K2P97_07480 [bacterium]|nr:hypothetical protein [bacterium]
MADLGTGLAIIGAAVGSKELIQKILGPTADYLGNGLKDLTEKRLNNIGRIFSKAEKKIGENINSKESVPPRILKEILEEGSFVDDELSAEYFAGILASSRSGTDRDDRTISALKQIETMSTYEIRSHYLFYTYVRKAFMGGEYQISKEADKFELFVPMNTYLAGMEIAGAENSNLVLSHSIVGLNNRNLIQNYSYGSKDFISKTNYKDADTNGIVFTPTPLGAQLFLLANGVKDRHENELIIESLSLTEIPGVKIEIGFRPTKIISGDVSGST